MIKRWQRTFTYINRMIDFIAVGLSYYAATWFWLLIVRQDSNNPALIPGNMFWFAFVFATFSVLGYQIAQLYDSVRGKPFRFEFRWVLFVNAVTVLGGGAAFYLLRLTDFSRAALAFFFVLSSVLVLTKRLLVRAVLSRYRSKGYNLKHVILIGSGFLAKKYVKTIQSTPQFGYVIDGYVGDCVIENLPCLGSWETHGNEVLSSSDIDEVVVALDIEQATLLPKVIAATEKYGTKVSIIPHYNDYIPSSTTIQALGECKLLNLRTTPLDSPVNAMMKRLFDIVSSIALIILACPLMLFAAIGTKLSSPGPIIFKQTRVGKNKRPFQMYKFRSMRVNASESTGWTKNDDPRKTRFGSLMRKTSIDELPQFFNVLKGDMSLIGPRPEVPHYVEQFQETVPLYMLKHLVRPGITGWAQVNGYRGDTSIEERVKHDIWYIEHWSLWLDIRICLRTAFGGIINQEKVAK
ncbi:MAG: undecaprenyl-phosphate glucose phosphotransferase [Clostridiales bacterium]|nr:undecaprenyl-phosphate glucose phosphotransferase [Clostridiales bacterium]